MTRFLGIDLSEGVKRRHLLAYFFAAFISSSYAGALAMLQPGLLQVMGIDRAAQATLTGNLSALQEIILILFFGPVGALADRYGRKPVYIFGLLMTALGFSLYPHADSMTELVLYRIIIAFGSAAMIGMMVTVIADYTRDSTRGKANGLQALIATAMTTSEIVFKRILVTSIILSSLVQLTASRQTSKVGGFWLFAA